MYSRGGVRPPLPILSQQGGEAGGSPIRVMPVRVGKRPRQSRNVSALPDGAGPASEVERSTRGTGVYVSQGWIGSNLVDVGRERCVPTCFVLLGTPGLASTTDREITVKGCGVAVVMPQGPSRAPPSSSESQ